MFKNFIVSRASSKRQGVGEEESRKYFILSLYTATLHRRALVRWCLCCPGQLW